MRSEHCLGALKVDSNAYGCFVLSLNINSKLDHITACQWITVAIILHNLIIDVEGDVKWSSFVSITYSEEGEAKRCQLIAELLAYREQMGIQF